MKKLAAIILLIVFLFHFIGYRGWFYLLEEQWQQQVENSLDLHHYNESELITIRVPLMLPYITDTKDFQRTDGLINANGKVYRYVKSKVENGEYVLRCLPDHHQQKLQKARNDFFEYANDLSATDGGSKKPGGKAPLLKLMTESDQHYFRLTVQPEIQTIRCYYQSLAAVLVSTPHRSPEQPPDNISYNFA